MRQSYSKFILVCQTYWHSDPQWCCPGIILYIDSWIHTHRYICIKIKAVFHPPPHFYYHVFYVMFLFHDENLVGSLGFKLTLTLVMQSPFPCLLSIILLASKTDGMMGLYGFFLEKTHHLLTKHNGHSDFFFCKSREYTRHRCKIYYLGLLAQPWDFKIGFKFRFWEITILHMAFYEYEK